MREEGLIKDPERGKSLHSRDEYFIESLFYKGETFFEKEGWFMKLTLEERGSEK